MPTSRPVDPPAGSVPRQPVYGPASVPDLDVDRDTPPPGAFPYTRGLYAGGYRDKLWTMRQFAGFGTPEETNARYKALLEAGGSGLSVAFDLPTLMGRDPDHPLAAGEVGKCGVSVATLADMEVLFDGIDLWAVSTSMTINSPAAMLLAMYLVAAERRGVAWDRLTGTLQNDILKEFIAQKEYIYPPRPSMRLVTDTFAFCARHAPRWNSISVSGYHIREAGASAAQELAFTLRDGIEYIQAGIDAGLQVDDFAPRVSFFFNAHSDFLEEIAKFRAARRIWARVMRDRFGARSPKSWQLRVHAQTAGVSLTAQQPHNNVVRTTVQALAAICGGTQSLHTNALDEALSLPTADAARLALRTQQILAFESGVADVVDPFGGAYAIERLTNELEAAALGYIARIDELGGMIGAIEAGFPQREIADHSYKDHQALESGRRRVVGVNVAVEGPSVSVPTLYVDHRAEVHQVRRLAEVRTGRRESEVRRTLQGLGLVAESGENVMPALLDCVRAMASLGEMCDELRRVWGEYEEVPII